MAISIKLLAAFITVIMVMVLGYSGYSLFIDYQNTRAVARRKIDDAIQRLSRQFKQIETDNKIFALQINRDPSLINAFNSKDRAAVGNALRIAIDKTGFVGFVTLVDDKGNVFYSTDTPAKSGYSARERSSGVDFVFKNNNLYQGPASFSLTGAVTISSMVPIRTTNRVAGVIAVNQPLNAEFLTGVVTEFSLQHNHLDGIDIALIDAKDGSHLTAVTSQLANSKNFFLRELRDRGLKAIPQMGGFFGSSDSGFENSGRWWKQFNLAGVSHSDVVAVLLITTAVPDEPIRILSMLGVAGGFGILAFLFALLFTAGISKGVNTPLRFLIKRTHDIASQKNVLPPLEGLSGDWLELAELMDTAVSSMRQTIISLKDKLENQSHQFKDKNIQTEDATSQMASLNRQFSNQSKQLTEVSKQINFANRQSVLLQRKLEAIMQVSTEGLLILDQFGNVLSANAIFLNWLGATEGEIAGSLCFDLVRKLGQPKEDGLHSKTFSKRDGNAVDIVNQFYPEGVVYHRNQSQAVEVIAHLQPIASDDSNIQGYVMVLRDKSARSEIAQLKREIVAMLSDSIRNNLVSSETRWQSILSNAPQTMHSSAGQSLAELHSQYEQLLGVVDSLLMMYGGFVPPLVVPQEQIMISRIVADCLEEVAPLARTRQLSLDYKTVTGLPMIKGNKDSVHGTLIEILEKMIQVTAAGGRVRVESQIKGAELRLGITSSGPALPEDEITDMFAGFIQGKHSEDTYGSRLSMYLARNNVERLGGKIWAESEAGRGTTIYFTVPIS